MGPEVVPSIYLTYTNANMRFIPAIYQKKSGLNLIPSSDWYESSKIVLNTIPAMYGKEKPPNIRTSLKAQKLIPVQNWKKLVEVLE